MEGRIRRKRRKASLHIAELLDTYKMQTKKKKRKKKTMKNDDGREFIIQRMIYFHILYVIALFLLCNNFSLPRLYYEYSLFLILIYIQVERWCGRRHCPFKKDGPVLGKGRHVSYFCRLDIDLFFFFHLIAFISVSFSLTCLIFLSLREREKKKQLSLMKGKPLDLIECRG